MADSPLHLSVYRAYQPRWVAVVATALGASALGIAAAAASPADATGLFGGLRFLLAWWVALQAPGAILSDLLAPRDRVATASLSASLFSPNATAMGVAWWHLVLGLAAVAGTTRLATILAFAATANGLLAAGTAILYASRNRRQRPAPPGQAGADRVSIARLAGTLRPRNRVRTADIVVWLLAAIAAAIALAGTGYQLSLDAWNIANTVRGRLDDLEPFRLSQALFHGWETLKAILFQVAGCDPIDGLQLYLPPLLAASALLATRELVRALDRRPWPAVVAVAIQLLWAVTDLRTDYNGYGTWLFCRAFEDKFFACLVLLPTVQAGWLRVLRRPRDGGLAWAAIATVAATATNPLAAIWLALTVGPFGFWRALVDRRLALRRTLVPLALGLAIVVGALGLAERTQVERRRTGAEANVALASLPPPSFRANLQGLTHFPLAALAWASGLGLLIGARRRLASQYFVASLATLSAVGLVPWLGAAASKVMGTQMLHRLLWAVPIPATVALALWLLAVRLVGALPADSRRHRGGRLRALAAATLLTVLVVAQAPRFAPAWRSFGQWRSDRLGGDERPLAAALRTEVAVQRSQLGPRPTIVMPIEPALHARSLLATLRPLPNRALVGQEQLAEASLILGEELLTDSWSELIRAHRVRLLVTQTGSLLADQLGAWPALARPVFVGRELVAFRLIGWLPSKSASAAPAVLAPAIAPAATALFAANGALVRGDFPAALAGFESAALAGAPAELVRLGTARAHRLAGDPAAAMRTTIESPQAGALGRALWLERAASLDRISPGSPAVIATLGQAWNAAPADFPATPLRLASAFRALSPESQLLPEVATLRQSVLAAVSRWAADDPRRLEVLGQTAESLGDGPAALAALRAAWTLNPAVARLGFGVARLADTFEGLAAGTVELGRILARHTVPPDPDVALAVAAQLLERRDLGAAATAAGCALDWSTDPARMAAAHRDLGEVARLQGRTADARNELVQAIFVDSQNSGLRARLAAICLEQKDLGCALRELEAAVALLPVDAEESGGAHDSQDWKSRALLGLVASASGRTGLAASSLGAALAQSGLDPASFAVWTYREALVHGLESTAAEIFAEQSATIVAAQGASTPEAAVDDFFENGQRGATVVAERLLSLRLARTTGTAIEYRRAGRRLIDRGGWPALALLYDRAIGEGATDVHLLLERGDAARFMRQEELALAYFRQAAALDADHPLVRDRLGSDGGAAPPPILPR